MKENKNKNIEPNSDIEDMTEAEFDKLVGKSKFIRNDKLVGRHTKFDQYLHDKFDIPAREKVKSVLGDIVKDNPNIYQQDLIITSKHCKYKYLEIQVINQWIENHFPYKNVYIYERKAKYNNDTLFLTLNRNLTNGYLFDRKSIENIKPRRFKKWSREFVYDIPWHRILPIDMNEFNEDLLLLY